MGKKYIDADKLAIDLQHRCDVVCPYTKAQRDVMCRACLLGDAIDTVEDQPAADVVEVVRCKDCKHSEEFIYPEGLEIMVCWEDNADREVNRNGFCEKGERKND